jgi:DNA polymerase-1
MSKKLLVLVDGSYYLFRAYHAMPDFTNSSGEPTGAIFGVINMIHKLLDDYSPDFFAVVFDAKGKNFRNDLYPDYKANRPPMPDDLSCQIAPLHEIIKAEGFPLLIIDNVEADDVIASLAQSADKSGISTIISTGDKDLAQIVNTKIHLINTMTNTLLDPAGVVEKYGVIPERIVDYLTLVGDSADNVPGVPKVGPKTAVKWINEYGSLDEIIKQADEIGGKVGENLRASLEQLTLSRELVTLHCNLNLGVEIPDLFKKEPDLYVLAESFKRWGFKSWLAQLPINNTSDVGITNDDKKPANYETILTEEGLDKWQHLLERAELIAFDTETTSLAYMRAQIVGISFAVEPGNAVYIPVAHDYPGAPPQLSLDTVLRKLESVLSSSQIKKLGHNLKYDKSVLANHGIELNGITHDSMLESYVLNSMSGRHNMDALALRYLDHETIHYEDVAGKGAKQILFNQVPLEAAGPYAAEDADITLRLHNHIWPLLSAEDGLKEVYEKLEIPLISVLSRIERSGVLIDADMLKKQSAELSARMIKIENDAQHLAGEDFNISSPKQIQNILYEKLGLPILSKTPKGQPSTAESVLQELSQEHELPRLILEYRTMSKLKSTYTDKLPEQINEQTGRIHTSYHQAVASTGRLSSADPNLQNIPIKSEEGRKIRQAFIAPPGHLIVAADYSQIELRIMAHLSGDKTLTEAFSINEDIHKKTAAEIFSVVPEQVTSDQRRAAKAINFGLIYGMSPFGLSKQLSIDISTAKDYVDKYFEKYPAVKLYMDNIREQAKSDGYVETVFKRRLYLPEINSRNAARRQYAERTAINAPMQGSAADLIKRAMIDIDEQLAGKAASIKMIMQVHDELVFEVAEESVNHYVELIREIMSSAPEISVPVVVDIGIGKNWDQAH